MTVIYVDDPRIAVLRLRVERASLAFRWLGAAGVVLEDVGYLLRRYDEAQDEIEQLRRTLASIADGLPAAPEKGEHIAHLSNRTEGDGSPDRA
jgi:hypothetical protein